ncbi:MAG: BLUF domain-containing protein [Erythrobacter sp.]
MKRLIYHSYGVDDLSQDAVFDIVSGSAHRNGALGLSGFLLYQNGCFLQLLEGDAAAVDALYAKVRQDPRHHSVETLFETAISAKSFDMWRMKRIASGNVAQVINTLCAHSLGPLPKSELAVITRFVQKNQAAAVAG